VALCSMLVAPTDQRAAVGFIFDHDQLHRSLSDTLGPTTLPRILDPATIEDTTIRAGNWHTDHQFAHDDFNLAIFGITFSQNLADSNLLEPASLAWWTFVNHQEHFRNNQIP
jgi:hypothetical protein